MVHANGEAPKARRATMADVARLAAVSASTVSFVLNENSGQTIRPVDAILFAVTGTRRITLPDALKGVPSVLVNGFTTGGSIPAVLPDEVTGGRQATGILLAAGHRRIAYFTGHQESWATRARVRGLRAALAQAGLAVPDQVVRVGNYRADSGYELTREVLAGPHRPTAILCGNDRMAIGVYLALNEAGLRIPEDMSVVGYDDQVDLAARLHPPLTTVGLPYYQMGRWAAGQVVAGSVAELPTRTYLTCPPVIRTSVTVPREG